MNCLEYLQHLKGMRLLFLRKIVDTELYEFVFGSTIKELGNGKLKLDGESYVLHVLCNFEIIRKNDNSSYRRAYYEDTPHNIFYDESRCIKGLDVRRVELSKKNDLWLDLGEYWIVFATNDDGEESWRIFMSSSNSPHLIASNCWINFD